MKFLNTLVFQIFLNQKYAYKKIVQVSQNMSTNQLSQTNFGQVPEKSFAKKQYRLKDQSVTIEQSQRTDPNEIIKYFMRERDHNQYLLKGNKKTLAKQAREKQFLQVKFKEYEKLLKNSEMQCRKLTFELSVEENERKRMREQIQKSQKESTWTKRQPIYQSNNSVAGRPVFQSQSEWDKSSDISSLPSVINENEQSDGLLITGYHSSQNSDWQGKKYE